MRAAAAIAVRARDYAFDRRGYSLRSATWESSAASTGVDDWEVGRAFRANTDKVTDAVGGNNLRDAGQRRGSTAHTVRSTMMWQHHRGAVLNATSVRNIHGTSGLAS